MSESPEAPPSWLIKLEERREQIKGKLGHESGNGAPCMACGSDCPGLDLHFWRKVCRNCKCRKEQHDVKDDDVTGWAQFEILGAIRAKPAFIKIAEFTDKPVKLDWVPPNTAQDVAADYMSKLGKNNIPICGSDAALRRKQQLEFQVPPHDLDSSLCHNLTENEAQQMQQYVSKIKDHCVGQGNVVRIGEGVKMSRAQIHERPPNVKEMDGFMAKICNNDDLKKALSSKATITGQKRILRLGDSQMQPDYMSVPVLSDKVKYKLKLMKIDSEAVKSAVENGPQMDEILNTLDEKNVDYKDCAILRPVQEFRKEYLNNPKFQNEINNFVDFLNDTNFNSPLPVKNLSQMGRIQNQETPVRKLNFNQENQPNFGSLYIPTIEKDKILSNILHSDIVQGVLQNGPVVGAYFQSSAVPMIPDFQKSPLLSAENRQKLENMMMNTQGIQSGVIHGPIYDELLDKMKRKRVHFADDAILAPMDQFRDEYLNNEDFQKETNNFVRHSDTSAFDAPSTTSIPASQSNDSGFGSVPPTPNYASYPGGDLIASEGVLTEIPGIADMNMYPSVKPGFKAPLMVNALSEDIANINLSPQNTVVEKETGILCNGCKTDILTGEVAVKADRAGKEATWHPQCFKCFKCNELLADLVYFYHGGNVYCARDLAETLKIPRCAACDELIFTKEYTLAENATFHIKHFCCYQCDAPLAGHQYIPDEKSNMPLCLGCYDAYHAKSCNLCKKNIRPTEQGVAWGKIHWHSYCFLCAGRDCGKSLIGGRFCVKNELPFCSPQCLKSILN